MTSSTLPSRAQIQADQLDKLRTLIAALLKSNAFYGPKLQAADITADIQSISEFTERMPFTVKADLAADQQAHPPYGTNLTYPELAQYVTSCIRPAAPHGEPHALAGYRRRLGVGAR